MTAELAVNLIGNVAWPLVVVVVLLAFRKSLLGLVERTREFEGPGDLKIKLDPARVQQIVEDARRENLPAEAVTERIIDEAVVDEREFRILRALVGESEGRRMLAYQNSFYRPALERLMAKGWIARNDNKFTLSPEGLGAVSTKLFPMLKASRFVRESGGS